MGKRVGCMFSAIVLFAALALFGCSGATQKENVDIRVWTYYNGDQLAAFQDHIEEFNATVGADEGIHVEGYNLGSVDDLKDAALDSVRGKVGAEPVPNVVMAYADTAYSIDQMGMVADLTPYFTDEERDLYIDGYLEEGTLGGAGTIKIFPIAKSVELFVLNKTDFEPFAQATGVTTSDLQTFEGLVEVSRKYYEWTDSQTPEPDDGKAFCGFDSMANYCFIGAKQLGVSLVSVDDGEVVLDFDKQVARKLWDCYYVPFLQGYFDATGRYRSDDIKTGNIISLVGSSSGATYFPDQVVDENNFEHSIEMEVLAAPLFAGGEAWAVQQGAGMVVLDTSDEEVEASVRFLKWFTEPEQNVKFSVSSGYLPVTKSANSMDMVRAAAPDLSDRMDQVLSMGISTVESNTLYTPPAFERGSEFRDVLEYSMKNLASSDLQVVEELVGSGTSRSDAVAPYLTDAHFEKWYSQTLSQLEGLVR
ncbi:MAG: extracellular solute-binding protein [Eggerthellaceae bacterium]|nr:extracellular solute-binding protein [Eggerthellaceae bacterium]